MRKIHKHIDPKYILENINLIKRQCLENIDLLNKQVDCLLRENYSSGATFFIITMLEELAKYYMVDKLKSTIKILNALMDHRLKAEEIFELIYKKSGKNISADDTDWLKRNLSEVRGDSIYVRLRPHKEGIGYPMSPSDKSWGRRGLEFFQRMNSILKDFREPEGENKKGEQFQKKIDKINKEFQSAAEVPKVEPPEVMPE